MSFSETLFQFNASMAFVHSNLLFFPEFYLEMVVQQFSVIDLFTREMQQVDLLEVV